MDNNNNKRRNILTHQRTKRKILLKCESSQCIANDRNIQNPNIDYFIYINNMLLCNPTF